jgi:hypothetical protein
MLSRSSKSDAEPPEIHSQAEPENEEEIPPEILSGNDKNRRQSLLKFIPRQSLGTRKTRNPRQRLEELQKR